MMWRVDSRCSLLLTPFLMVMANELLRVLPGFIYAAAVGISRDHTAMLVFFAGFVSLSGGLYCSLGYLRYRTSIPKKFLEIPLYIKSEGDIFWAIFCGSLLLMLAGFYMYEGIPTVTDALLALLAGGEGEEIALQVTASRLGTTKGHYFGGAYRGQGVISVLMRVGWPLLVSVAFIIYFRTRKIKWLSILIILFFLSFLFIAGDGRRGPFISTFIVYIILLSFIKKLNLRFVAIGAIVIFTTAILMGLYSAKMFFLLGSDNFLITAVENMLNRIFLGNAINDAYAIEFVRNGTINLRLGMIHLRDLQAAMPGISGGLPFSNELALLINPAGSATTYASGTYITKSYVDFGMIGVGVSFFFIGLLAGFAQRLIFYKPHKDPFHLAISAMLIYFTGLLVLTSPMSVFSSILVLLFFYLFLQIAIKIFGVIKFAASSK